MAKQRHLSQAEFADEIGLSARQIRRIPLPTKKIGRKSYYIWPDALHAYIEHRLQSAAAPRGPVELDEARTRKVQADAELAELQLARERGELISVDDAINERATDYGHLRAKLLNMPAKYAPTTIGCRTIAESKIRWEAAIIEAMSALSDPDDEYSGADAS